MQMGCIGKHQRDRIYSIHGISPSINGSACDGAYNNQPLILIDYSTKITW